MVGAIADWFAVTALFKHPLGLPIPHTALIPKRKDELGQGLEEFVGRELPPGGDHPRRGSRAAELAQRVGDWLAEPANARRVVDEVADVAAIGLGKVRDEHIEELVDDGAGAAVPRGADRAARSAGCVTEVVRDDLHHGLRRPGPRGAARLAGGATRTRSPR